MVEDHNRTLTAPRWLNAALSAAGLALAGLLAAYAARCPGDPDWVPFGQGCILPRLLGSAVLPAVLAAAALSSAVRCALGWARGVRPSA